MIDLLVGAIVTAAKELAPYVKDSGNPMLKKKGEPDPDDFKPYYDKEGNYISPRDSRHPNFR